MHKRSYGFLIGGLLLAAGAHAQSWPAKPVRLIMATAAGTATDSVARLYTPQLSSAFGQPWVIENRAGAGGIVALEAVARVAPDGYTMLGAPGGIMVTGQHLYKLDMDIARDIQPVSPVSRASMFLVVRPGLPVKSVAELVALARDNPGKLNYASSGSGATPHLAAEMMMRAAGIKVVQVAYKSGAQALQDVVSGQVDFMFDPGAVVPLLKAGKVRLLAVARSTRSPFFPETPTMAEAGTDVDTGATTMTGLFAPAGVHASIVLRVNKEMARILGTSQIRASLATVGAEPAVATPEEFSAQLRRDRERFGAIIRDAGIKIE